MAADPATGDAKAAEVANAITGNTADGQAKFVSSTNRARRRTASSSWSGRR